MNVMNAVQEIIKAETEVETDKFKFKKVTKKGKNDASEIDLSSEEAIKAIKNFLKDQLVRLQRAERKAQRFQAELLLRITEMENCKICSQRRKEF